MRSLAPWVLCLAAAVPLACSGSGRDPVGANAPDGSTATGPNGGPTSENPPDISGQTGADSGPPVGGCVKDPANFDAPGDNCDNDNDGTVDNVAPACDASLAAAGTAEQFAQALGLCQKASGPSDTKWGVISASYRRGHNDTKAPADGQHGILTSFGPNVKAREGDAFGVLSTGWAREYDDETNKTSAFKKGGAMQPTPFLPFLGPKAPPGFPKSSANCPAIPIAQDIAVVRLEIKVPNNAQGLAFDFNFYSGEWPEYVCSTFNDSFIAYLKSSAFNNGQPDNISFDAKGSPVSINNAFFDRCTNGVQTGCKGSSVGTSSCAGGESELEGTGFKEPGNYCNAPSVGGGATGWLTSQAPVKPGETIELEFYIWDGTDPAYNSSVLLDNFKWVPTPVAAETTRPPK